MTNDSDKIWHPYTRSSCSGMPVITSGEGVYLTDSEGARYFDAISSWWSANLGHSHPRLVRAITEQTARLQHSILGSMSTPPALALAKSLSGLFDSPRHVMFASDGSSAVEAALKIAVQYRHNTGQTGKCRFASLSGAYHGDTLGAVSAGFLETFHSQFREVTFPVYQADAPFCAGCSFGLKPETCSCECFDSMREIINTHSDELTAVIVEPLCQGAAGMRIYPPEYLKRLSEECRENDILLIADEIAVGYGRTGRMFAFEHAGIDPDIVCLGKGITGGTLPLSATVVKDSIYETFSDTPVDRTFYHGHTFAGNPIACAAALEVLDIYRDDSILESVIKLSASLAEHWAELADIPSVTKVRSLGLIAAIDMPDPAMARTVRDTMLEHNVLIRPLGNVIYLMAPFVTTQELLQDTINHLKDSCIKLQPAG